MSAYHWFSSSLAVLTVTACGTESNDPQVFDTMGADDSTDGGDEEAGDAGSTTGTSDDGSDTGDETEDDDDGGKFDVNMMPDVEVESGCQKVDLLFVIDSTGSMGPHQQNLIESYDGFVDGISAHFGEDRDFHIGVISTDAYKWNEDSCIEKGALVTQVIDQGWQNVVECSPYAEGNRFMTEADDLATAFPCTANINTGGDKTPQPARAAIAAIQPEINDVGGCNEGFLRDDALLVLVLITDSMSADVPGADAHANENPAPWHPAIVDAKGGNPENAVAIGFIASGDTWCIPNGYDGYQAPNLIDFIGDFGENGVVHNVCSQDYATEFANDIDLVLDACEGFVDPG